MVKGYTYLFNSDATQTFTVGCGCCWSGTSSTASPHPTSPALPREERPRVLPRTARHHLGGQAAANVLVRDATLVERLRGAVRGRVPADARRGTPRSPTFSAAQATSNSRRCSPATPTSAPPRTSTRTWTRPTSKRRSKRSKRTKPVGPANRADRKPAICGESGGGGNRTRVRSRTVKSLSKLSLPLAFARRPVGWRTYRRASRS
jgi:hypothetical protein